MCRAYKHPDFQLCVLKLNKYVGENLITLAG